LNNRPLFGGAAIFDIVLSMHSEDLVERLLFRDGLMLVLNKPYGIAVHRGPNGGDCLENYFAGLRFGLPRDPALAHRLDKNTTGCLILGRHHKALQRLGQLFKRGQVQKTYWAIVENGPSEDTGLIDLPLARLDPGRGWWMKIDRKGVPAQTRFCRLGRKAGRSWLALEPLTGRTHQLRVHCAAMGWPIAGDGVYGGRDRDNEGCLLQLHAREIIVPLYPNKPPIRVTAPVPEHMAVALAAFTAGRPLRICARP
jgi:tRNA pseudouridine32 synthase/23S rRNA pseudouridine746 synthase